MVSTNNKIFNLNGFYVEIFMLTAVKESLTRDGHMNKFKAELRAAVISVLNKSTGKQSHVPPDPPAEARIINDLIKEYLEWMGFRYSEQVLSAGNKCNYNIFLFYYFLFSLKM